MDAHRTARRTTVSVGVAALLLGVVAPVSAAGPPLTGSGAGHITSLQETSSRDAGGNRIAERRLTGVLTSGPLSGTYTQTVRGVVHADGTVSFSGTMRFTGTVEGCGQGTVDARIQGKGQAGAAPVTEGTITLVGGASSTLSATGHGTVQQAGPLVTYEVQYLCR